MSKEGEQWLPLYARVDGGEKIFFKLHEGVPGWLQESLWEWFNKRISNWRPSSTSSIGGYWDPDVPSIRELERIIRVAINWTGRGDTYGSRSEGREALRAALYADQLAFLTAVDYQLSKLDSQHHASVLLELERILKDAASEWRVSEIAGRPGLGKRVDETVQAAAQALAAREVRSGTLLADAWRHAFSMNRDPSAAYRCAVRAVEAAAGPILTPADSLPTLGKMIAAFRDKPGKWEFSFTVDSSVDPKLVLLQMIQLLWTNEYSRHVDPDVTAPLHVTQAEAESAVALALTLTTWFTSGAIKLL